MKRAGRIRAHEKFLWRGLEFRLSRADSQEARWQFERGQLRIQVIYHDSQSTYDCEHCAITGRDPATKHACILCDGTGQVAMPPEFTALIRIHGGASASGVAGSVELALDYALRDLKKTLRNSVRLLMELQRGRDPSSA